MPSVYTWPLLDTPPPPDETPPPLAPAQSGGTVGPGEVVRDFALDAITGDLVLFSGDVAVVTGLSAILQSVRMHMQFFKAEWFLDLDAGLPYYQDILVKNPSPEVLKGLFRSELLSVPGVRNVRSLDLDFDSRRRALTVTFSADTDVGALSNISIQVAA